MIFFDGYKPTLKNEMEANMENGLYTAHEVAVILADAFGDDCACNFNGNDEWLPYLCELQDACPHPCGVACWEQYLKYKDRNIQTHFRCAYGQRTDYRISAFTDELERVYRKIVGL